MGALLLLGLGGVIIYAVANRTPSSSSSSSGGGENDIGLTPGEMGESGLSSDGSGGYVTTGAPVRRYYPHLGGWR